MSERELHRIAVIGGGMMGRSLATRVSQAGLGVVVREISGERTAEVQSLLAKDLDREIDRYGLTQSEKKAILARINFTTELADTRGCDLAIETISEDAAAKRSLLAELDGLQPPDIPIVVNTSTLSITELAQGLAHPERIIGMHFLYPVTTTRVVEVVKGQVSSDDAFQAARRFARVLGKVPIEEFESPGFVTTRVVMPLVNEAAHVVMEGVATAAEVDLAIKLGYEFRHGPLEWADRVGLHRILNWLEHLFQETGDPKFRPCPLIRKLVRAGHTGARVGRGFFTYDIQRSRLDRLPDDTPKLA
ncbi:MAG TPA: 3-hydroxyacyl-CoA dehydrogenase NAD-binding domain-containing protein [Thermoanaerobaculaceae bacterium]|nr:3-hydroxyacyl-CoA dehydrogenase NAD-binding domain-containing protein [Thermoanaerobaculaceae bacterium]